MHKVCALQSTIGSIDNLLEAISKLQIRFEGKAQVDEKAQQTREYVSILR